MDTVETFYSTTYVADWLGVSVPTMHRAMSRLGLEPRRGPKGHLRLNRRDIRALLADLGRAPRVKGFSREELFVLNVLQRRPFGLRSGRLVARHAGISPTTALKALNSLERRGMVEHRHQLVAEGVPKEVTVWVYRVEPYWLTDAIALQIRNTIPPAPRLRTQRDTRVPQHFRHLFWNADLRELNTKDHGSAIATAVLEQDNPHALAWAIQNLSPEAFAIAALPRRGSIPEMSALAAHIAGRK
ncbi:MAG: hypothetical protein ACP5HZ_03715 [Ferrimicrobium sp.]